MKPKYKHQLNSHGLLRFAVSAVTFAMLSGCVSFSGIESSAKLNSLSQAANIDIYGQQKGQWPDNQWAKKIGGKDLQDLIDNALTNSPSLQVAAARINAARAASDYVGANRLPSVNAGFENTYQRFTENGLIPPPLAGNYYSDNELTLSASYDVDFWGKHKAEMRSALSQEQVAAAEQQSARLMLSNAVARSWVQLARQYAQLDLSKQQLAVREKFDALIAQRVKAGLDTKSDIQQGLIQVSALKNDISSWESAIALTRNQLAALMGQDPTQGLMIPRPQYHPTQNTQLPENLPLELISRRPDIVAARWRVEASQGDIEAAKTQFYPNINIIGFAGLSDIGPGAGLERLFKSSSLIVGAGPSIHLPVFEGGRLRAQLKNKVAGYDVAVATYNQSLTDALHDVADQIQTIKASEIELNEQGKAEQATKINLQLAQQRQKAGTANMLPVLSAESALLTQQKQTIDITFRRAESHLNLIKALGGGYDSKTDQINSQTTPATPASNKPEAA
ncbi:efflux transporter outer membrane subunit [Undibacterium sp. RuRC25W]|uniref:efflux transporter outer membrane subunit n=1 Tax=Undibacterium sp. RuRC25W TaxID=3413047 RepID=UPI003BF3AFD8